MKRVRTKESKVAGLERQVATLKKLNALYVNEWLFQTIPRAIQTPGHLL